MGFFVNEGATDPGDSDMTADDNQNVVRPVNNVLRDTISHMEGSGSLPKPANNARDKVPTVGQSIDDIDNVKVNNDEENKQTAGSLKASLSEDKPTDNAAKREPVAKPVSEKDDKLQGSHKSLMVEDKSDSGASPAKSVNSAKADSKKDADPAKVANKVVDAAKVANTDKIADASKVVEPAKPASAKDNKQQGSLKSAVTEDKSENEKSKDSEDEDPGDKRKKKSTTTCEGSKEWLQCDGPYELIKIKNAFWGRDNSHTCTRSGKVHGLKTDQNCAQDEQNTMNKVREACDNENVCEVVASPVYFDKTDCPDVYKFLRMDYECAPSESRIKESKDN